MSGVAVASAAVGGLIASSGAKSAARTSAAAQDRAAQLAYEQSLPWTVTGAGGEAGFDEGGRLANLTLAPELQNIYQGMLTRSGTWAPMVQDIIADPFAAQQRLYQQQQALFAPEQQRERLALENRLLAQGMLGSTGGALRSQALSEAQGTQNLQRQIAAMTQAQGLIDTYLGRETSDIGQAAGLLNIPLQYANLGRGIGGDLSSVATTGAALRSIGAQNLADTQAAISGGIGRSLAGLGSSGSTRQIVSGMFGGGTGYNPFQSGFYGYNPSTASTYGTSPFSQQTAMLAAQEAGF
jgi:hypothetical protein